MRLSRFFKYAAAGIVAGGIAYHEVKNDSPPPAAPDEIGDLIRSLPDQGGTTVIYKTPKPNIGQRLDLQQASFLKFEDVVAPLAGQVAFCKRLPKECDHRSDYQETVVLDSQTFNDFLKMNIDANSAIRPRSDKDKYKKEEYWNIPKFVKGKGLEGDCEDYVLYKIKQLEKMGVPHAAMSIVFVKAGDEGHAILAVRTDKGDLLFDNLTNALMFPQEKGYKFYSATSLTNEREWRKLEDVLPAVSAAKGGRASPPPMQSP